MRVLDVSQYNGAIDFDTISQMVEGIIIRAGYRGYGASGTLVTDSAFRNNIAEAARTNIPMGVYFVTQAINEAEAREEARYCIDLVKGYNLAFPVFIDTENSGNGEGRAAMGKLTVTNRTAIIKAFCEEVEANGREAGVYASLSWFENCLYLSEIDNYFIWCARYSSTAPDIPYDAWQYTSKGQVAGIKGNVDVSNFDKYSKNENPTPTPAPTPAPTPTSHNVGDNVNFNAIYVSATSTEALNPTYTSGTITKIKAGAPNPYLINDGMGWVNDGCIIGSVTPEPTTLNVGDKIRIANGAKDLNTGGTYASYVYNTVYSVIQIKGDRVVFGLNGEITGATNVTNCIKA